MSRIEDLGSGLAEALGKSGIFPGSTEAQGGGMIISGSAEAQGGGTIISGSTEARGSAASLPVTPPAGRKDDLGKLRYDLVPLLAEQQMVAVLTFGATKKYTPDGWRTVPDGKARYYAALRRHVAKWAMGEKLDPESGLPHLAHALCCLAFLAELDAQ